MMLKSVPVQNTPMSKRAIEILHLLNEGMSDREIAEQLVMTVNTVKWYNRQIYSTLGVGSRTEAIAHAHKLHLLENTHRAAPALQVVPREAVHNFPVKPTEFIGREDELNAITGLLDKVRLLTLVGAPGVGKTRLALQTASVMASRFRHGVHFVSLASVHAPALVIAAIARSLGVSESRGEPLIETVKRFLHNRQILLILDNFEHLCSAVIDIADLLSVIRTLKILVTSRVPLHIYGEHEYTVLPLGLPDHVQVNPLTLASCEATALFIQQARSVRPDFELTQENAVDVARICMLLDGVPLAIELAAATLKMLTPQYLLASLKTNLLGTLIGGAYDLPMHQQTMRSAIGWSYDLLNESEKLLFARLSVFEEPASVETIEAVCGKGLTTNLYLSLLTLMDNSLLERTETADREPCFGMLGMIRQYAEEQLEESGEAEMIRQRYTETLVQRPHDA